MATILILDNDLGFSFWLGLALNAPHCRALPAKSVVEAAALIAQYQFRIDFLIMSPAVPGAAEFTRALKRDQKHLRVATLVLEAAETLDRIGLESVVDQEH